MPISPEIRARMDRDREAAEREAGIVSDASDGAFTVFVCPQGCKCQCPDGPCEHVWDHWAETENGGTAICSRCGMDAMSHDMRCGP